jgi:hypothetical protein
MRDSGGAEADRPSKFSAETVAQMDQFAKRIVDAPDPMSVYWEAMEVSGDMIGRAESSDVDDGPEWALYLIWAALTDGVDAPGANTNPLEASTTMKRAASEWLTLGSASHDRQAYLDWWKFNECGYERPGDTT